MSEVLGLTDERLAEALRCCAKNEAAACRKCPMGISTEGEKCCFDALRLKAAERIGALAAENRRLQGIVDGFASKVEEQMVRIARECNGAGGSEAADRAVELSLLQAELAAMDRECIIQAEPVVGGWRVDWIRVGDREIYRREDGPDGED